MIFVFGHRNPDTDSVASAIALSYLKNKLGYNTIPCVLGDLNKETEYILDKFEIEKPKLLDNVKTQIKDLDYDKVDSIGPYDTILTAYKIMESRKIRTLPIVDKSGKLLGIVTMKDIAMELIRGDFYSLKTRINNIVDNLEGEILVGEDKEIEGKISVVAFYYDTIKEDKILNENSIVIVGDRYDIVDYSIECKVKLIIITGGKKLPEKYLKKAQKNNVDIISVKGDTYTISKLINQCNYISSIMKDRDIIKFYEREYLEDVKEVLLTSKHSNYPIVNDDNQFLGFMNRRHILNPNRKKVILVDHNESNQSIEGLSEAEIIEVVDHHKIGNISTSSPILFRNMPVGSTCTIVYKMYKEYGIDVEDKIAGILISGIISDTMFFKSPTTTEEDKKAVYELNSVLKLDLEKYAMDMFRAGTSLEGQSIDEIFLKDFKEFTVKEKTIGISQVFTLDIEQIFNKKDEFLSYINDIHKNKQYYLTLLLITDILKEGSYIFYKSENDKIITVAFNKEGKQGMFVESLVSRKKQVLPKILEAIELFNQSI
ncbi:manganese-dependent inorganic pyrophosphatase [Caminicella sporogenes DSM 14501]|uniref:inorganic diphosphatase n=1 Tax=Caminicella sporogenes DSM 14501 TaxID=1121266 RepID=A0A1M6KYP0_9FIRM|nr:putative manganese-dependent inorganic diphosphatase [Caminicella sporogenes]RKD27649.1 inorganic pyrophosphatase [Caminicella sporogenes]SHJ64121.1 manganese-dependent inorganic pyrophosphatase [Caminicella sporogenes DSM 14501]